MVHHCFWSGKGHEIQLAVCSSGLTGAATPCLAAEILQAAFRARVVCGEPTGRVQMQELAASPWGGCLAVLWCERLVRSLVASLLAAYCKPEGLLSKGGKHQRLAAGTTSASRQLIHQCSEIPARLPGLEHQMQNPKSKKNLEGHLVKSQSGKATHEEGDQQ